MAAHKEKLTKGATGILLRLLTPLLLLLSACVNDDEPENRGIGVGDLLPEFTITLNDGETVSTSTLRGKRVLIELFNTGCSDCRESLPVINQLYLNFADNPEVKIFSIAREEDATAIGDYWQKNNLSLPYSPQGDREIYELFATTGIPRIYIASPDGIITTTFGPSDRPSPSQLTNLLLGSK